MVPKYDSFSQPSELCKKEIKNSVEKMIPFGEMYGDLWQICFCFLGPFQTSNFTCAESNANERKQ